MNATQAGEPELHAIQEDLAAIRACLVRNGLEDMQELAGRLRSVVERFRHWISLGPVERESIFEIQRQLGELQPLFENAYELHAGWFGMLDLKGAQGAGEYGASGQQQSTAGSVGAVEHTFVQRG